MAWKNMVGLLFKGWTGEIYVAESYDKSHGFWMVAINDPTNRHDVSEAAIGRSYHELDHCYYSPSCQKDNSRQTCGCGCMHCAVINAYASRQVHRIATVVALWKHKQR